VGYLLDAVKLANVVKRVNGWRKPYKMMIEVSRVSAVVVNARYVH